MHRHELLATVGLGWLMILAFDGTTFAETIDVWRGKHRDDMVATLGEPDKAKKARGGGQVLTYRLYRVSQDFVPGPDLLVLDVPGVGRVGRTLRAFDPFAHEATTLEPTQVADKEGTLVPGGPRTSRTHSSTWSREKGKWKREDEETAHESARSPAKPGNKIKLTFELDPAGKIVGCEVVSKH